MAFNVKWKGETVSGVNLTAEQAMILLKAGVTPSSVGRNLGGSRHYDMRAGGKDSLANAAQIKALGEGRLDASLLTGKGRSVAVEVAKLLNVPIERLKGPYLLCLISGRFPSDSGWTSRTVHEGTPLDIARRKLADVMDVEVFRTGAPRPPRLEATAEPEAPAKAGKAKAAKPAGKAPAEAAAAVAKARKPRKPKATVAPAPETAPEAPAPEVMPAVPDAGTGTAGE